MIDSYGPRMSGGVVSEDLSELVAFVESVVGGRAVNSPRRLRGGIASEVLGLTCAVEGQDRRVVARRYVGDLPFKPGPPTIEGEASTLTQLEDLGIPAPRLIGADPSGDAAGRPTLVMTRLPGRLVLQPSDPSAWTEALAEMLVAIHALPVTAPPYEAWLDLATVQVPPWTSRPDVWSAALEFLASSPPTEPEGFVHGDYQQFNVLWSGGEVSGVLDWTGSWVGPPDADVAHARLNLVCLYDVERAEDFRREYESRAGRVTSPWRDVAELVGLRPPVRPDAPSPDCATNGPGRPGNDRSRGGAPLQVTRSCVTSDSQPGQPPPAPTPPRSCTAVFAPVGPLGPLGAVTSCTTVFGHT
jgi:aminoglycoside phosphotransferase (APT) family kinase protein